MKFKRVRNRRDLRNNPAQLSLIIDEESEALGGVVFNVTQKSGQMWASCPGRPPDPWSVLFSSLCPSSSSDAATYVFFPLKLRVSILHAPWLVEWGPASMA